MKRTGFTTVIALTVLALIAAALSALAIGLHVEAKRTQSAQIQAELRQLLLAAASDAQARSRQWPAAIQPTDWEVALPADFLNQASVVAHLTTNGSDEVLVSMTAKIDKHRLTQQLHFNHEHEGWKIVDASLRDGG